MLKFFDWLRIFDRTGFFVELIVRTIVDVYPFMILIFIALLTSGIPIMLLSLSRDSEANSASFFSMFAQTLLQQYLISLGEFPLDDWDKQGDSWLWMIMLYFFLSTFFVQITMFNMLIAIMTETFEKVHAKQEIKANKAKLKFVGELANASSGERLFSGRNTNVPCQFLYVVKPIIVHEQDIEEDKTIAAIDQLTRLTEMRLKAQETSVNDRIDQLKTSVEEMYRSTDIRLN